MSKDTSEQKRPPVKSTPERSAGSAAPEAGAAPAASRKERRRWWIKMLVQPLVFLAAGALLIAGLGLAQRLGWIDDGGGSDGGSHSHGAAADENALYICPMMCTPPSPEPGRCPVCAMELVPTTSGTGSPERSGDEGVRYTCPMHPEVVSDEPGRCPICGMELVPASTGTGGSDELSIQIDPVARRLANIQTVPVKSVPLVREVRAIGELTYDEGRLKTIAAYVDGRIERLYADYTGIVVKKGDRLALVYSPQLYSSQVELLVARRARERGGSGSPSAAAYPDLYAAARERLIEFGMTPAQVDELEKAGEASSRLQLLAPISGTVIEKLAVEGQYVETGRPIYRLADLSTVWLMLELFPEDAAGISDGQEVSAEVQSLPGRKFTGRVAFIDPTVNPKTRTIGVRVVIPNDEGLMRVGDYATATIAVEPSDGPMPVVPRNAVLMAGDSSVVYVETEPGRFEVRNVVLGPSSGEQIAILEGVEEGEQVATSGNFLIDSQMQLVGKPSLIDPAKAAGAGRPAAKDSEHAAPQMDLPPIGVPEIVVMPEPELSQAETPPTADSPTGEDAEALASLSPSDRALAEKQKICPVTGMPLGSMGAPIKVEVDGRAVFICCEGCRESLLEEPSKYLARLHEEVEP